MKKKICVITGTRAEYGLLRRLIGLIDNSSEFNLQLIVTGTHLSPKYGETYMEIESDGFLINKKIDLNIALDTPVGMADSTSLGLTGFARAFDSLNPDLIIILGDRYEILSAAIAAMFTRIPIAHIHGGELTEGVIDESIRHALTKFSHLHFVANEQYRQRVIQLGENPNTVFNVGGMGVDAINSIALLDKSKLENLLDIKFRAKNLLVTYHPVTLENRASAGQVMELLDALSEMRDTSIIFTMPNADTDNIFIFNAIEDFVSKNPNAYSFTSMGQLKYLSCLAQVDAIVGNSSSGLTEAPTFKKPTINIGDRQKGRIQCESIINCQPIKEDIREAIELAYTKEFRDKLLNLTNPYGYGGAPERILDTLKCVDFNMLIKKEFYDLEMR